MLGQVEGQEGWHSVSSAPTAEQRPGVLVYRWEAPLFFANAGMFRQQIRRLVRDGRPTWVVLQCEAITDIDVTAADMLEQLDIELNAQGIHVAFVELRERLQDLVYRYGLFETLDRDHFYDSIDEALAAIEAEATRRRRILSPTRVRPDPEIEGRRAARHAGADGGAESGSGMTSHECRNEEPEEICDANTEQRVENSFPRAVPDVLDRWIAVEHRPQDQERRECGSDVPPTGVGR